MTSPKRATRALDRIDRNILRTLQADGRIAMTELAERVGLSVSPCTERVRRLERERYITGYHARLDPHLLGQSLLVFGPLIENGLPAVRQAAPVCRDAASYQPGRESDQLAAGGTGH